MIGMRTAMAAALAAAALVPFTARSAAPAAAAPVSLPVQSRAVSFPVRNTNRSMVPCDSDGAAYMIVGHLVAPAARRGDGGTAGAVVLDLHGLGFGEFFWSFDAAAGYDWARALAARGVVSVVIDRIGYGLSGRPPGEQSCIGAQADVAHQIVQELRSGSYALDGGDAPRFGRVALAGHSAGGAITQIEAYSFHDVDGVMVLSYADLGPSVRTLGALTQAVLTCLGGGSPPGHAPFGRSDADFQALMFHDADPRVIAAVTAMRNPEPCGDDASLLPAIATDVREVPRIAVPVLLLIGDHDAVFPPPMALESQRRLFAGSHDVTAVTIPDTGHAVTVERSAGVTRDAVVPWLCGHSFCAWRGPRNAAEGEGFRVLRGASRRPAGTRPAECRSWSRHSPPRWPRRGWLPSPPRHRGCEASPPPPWVGSSMASPPGGGLDDAG
jgi:pimeloyl-ACP methyl ester carboxylesterase